MRRRTIAMMLLFSSGLALAGEASKSNPTQDSELRLELLGRVKTDQDARNALVAWLNEHDRWDAFNPATLDANRRTEYERIVAAVKRADRENTERLVKIVEKYGWPTATLVGKDGARGLAARSARGRRAEVSANVPRLDGEATGKRSAAD